MEMVFMNYFRISSGLRAAKMGDPANQNLVNSPEIVVFPDSGNTIHSETNIDETSNVRNQGRDVLIEESIPEQGTDQLE